MAISDSISLTRLAARRLKHISEDKLSAELRTQASLCILDNVGATHAGLTHELAESILKYTQQHAGQPEAYAFGSNVKVCAETAAFANGVLSHCVARDDMHLDAVAHLGSMVVPAALALAQRENWSGDQLIRAVVGGYEMGALLGTSIRESGKFNPHFRASGLIGAFAAAGAALCSQPVDEDTAVNTLALAVNCACGINEWAWSGGNEIFIHNGTASRAGISSYDLATAGVNASDAVLEGVHGFFNALGVGSSGVDTFRRWIQESKIGRGILDVKFKPAACCNFTQTSTSLARKMVKNGKLDPTDIDSIKVTTTTAATKYPGCDNTGPLYSAGQGKLSIQYGVCAALLLAQLDESAWDPRGHAAIAELMPKCDLVVSPKYDKKYTQGYQPAQVEVFLKNGEVLREEADDVPWLHESEVTERFIRELSSHASNEYAERILDRCQHLEKMDGCRELFEA